MLFADVMRGNYLQLCNQAKMKIMDIILEIAFRRCIIIKSPTFNKTEVNKAVMDTLPFDYRLPTDH